MRTLLTFLLCKVFLLGVCSADKCGDSCKDWQVCTNDGTCVDRSSLKHCGLVYCKKDQKCCGLFWCIPGGSVCCPNRRYCESGHACCGLLCCIPGAHCESGRCVLDGANYTTPKLPTTRLVKTSKMPVTTKLFTTRSAKATPKINDRKKTIQTFNKRFSVKQSFLWWHGIIVAAAVVLIAVAIGLFVWKRKSAASQDGRIGRGVVNAPSKSVNPQQSRRANAFEMASNRGVQPFNPPNNQHLAVANTGAPPYVIYSADGTAQPVGPGHTKKVPVYTTNQSGAYAVLNNGHSRSGRSETNKMKYLPQL